MGLNKDLICPIIRALRVNPDLHQRQGELNHKNFRGACTQRRLSKVVACCYAARALTTLMQAQRLRLESGMGTPRPAARPQAIAIRRGLALTPVFSSKL